MVDNHRLTSLKKQAQREGWGGWIRSEADEHAVLQGCRFSIEHAEHVQTFFRSFLRHSKGEWAGQPFELLDWQREDLIFPLFGWLRADGSRRYRRAYVELPKKNGKSTLASGIGLYMLLADGEQGAEIYSAAADRDQASIVHNEAINMINASPFLSEVLKVNKSTRVISHEASASLYKALSSTAASKEGLNGHCCVIDELHIWRGRLLWDALRYMGRARRQSLLFAITTAGIDMMSVCREQHDYAQKILDGTVFDERYFAYIRSCDLEDVQGDGLFDRDQWRKANPSMGITINEDEFAADVAEAAKTPTSLSSFMRYSFNIWATGTQPWLRISDWQACRSGHTPEYLEGQECWGAMDLASILDMASVSACFREIVDKDHIIYKLLTWFFMPEATAEQRQEFAPYLQWAENGWLQLTPGDVLDYEAVKNQVREVKRRFKLRELAFDPWNAEDATQQLERDGIKRVEFRQTMANFAHPTKEFERLLRSGLLRNDGNPILEWQAGNVQVRTDMSGNIRPVKPKHGDYRTIDGIVSSIMALERAMAAPLPPKGAALIV